MKKETKAYINNVIKSEFFLVDFINIILGIAILIIASLSILEGDQMVLYFLVFVLGALLMFLNCWKNIKKRSVLWIPFGAFSLVMIVAAFLLFRMI